MQHLQPNTTLQGGKYRIERVLGQGGFGNTYVAKNTVFDDYVAIKEFFMQGINGRDENSGSITIGIESNTQQFEEQREKFKKEARRLWKLKNEHIVKVHDLFEENGTAYYVMDYIDGENLAEHLKRTGKPMTEQEVRDILPQILDALKSIHDVGIWHLDLKPANILIDKSGNVKLIDFGASKQLNAQKGGATTSTAISYTNGYAPREQMEQNYDKFGPWTDIYALGATLYNLLTNKRPPLPTDIDDDMSEDKHNALPFPESVGGMKYLVLRMMKTNRLQRPQSIDAIISAERLQTEELKQAQNQQLLVQSTIAYNDEETIIVEPQEKEKTKASPNTQSNFGNNTMTQSFFNASEYSNNVSHLQEKENEPKSITNLVLTYLKNRKMIIFSGFIISYITYYTICGDRSNFLGGEVGGTSINLLGDIYMGGMLGYLIQSIIIICCFLMIKLIVSMFSN